MLFVNAVSKKLCLIARRALKIIGQIERGLQDRNGFSNLHKLQSCFFCFDKQKQL